MNEKNWGQDAPQVEDTEQNGREQTDEAAPRYEHYQMHQSPARPELHVPVKKKRKRSAGRRLAGTISLAVVFGVVAGAAFQGTNYVAGRYLGTRKQTSVGTVQMNTEQTAAANTSAAAGDAAGTDTSAGTAGGTGSVAQVASAAMPAVVAITSVSVQQIPSIFGAYGFGTFGTREYSSEGSGSGIIVGENDDELLIATNNHVVDGADTLSVCFIGNDVENAETETATLASGDGELNVKDAVSAKIKGTDQENDLAVVAVQKSDIPSDTMKEIKVAQLGSSDSLQVGDQVVAIGNALGYGQSVTSGWISAMNRSISTDDGTSSGLIQTDAAINPGNSGGALLNMQGELIGINSAKYADSAVEGMGYAIPISKAQPILENLMNRQTRDKVSADKAAYLGVRLGDLTTEAVEMYNMPSGAFVFEAEPGEAAANAGIQKGDVIVKLDGQTISGEADLTEKLSYYAAGETVDMAICRADNGQYVEQTVQVTLGAKPQY